MSEPTAKELARRAASVTLLLNPGAPTQRALWVGPADRIDYRNTQLTKALTRHGLDARLAWSYPDGRVTPA